MIQLKYIELSDDGRIKELWITGKAKDFKTPERKILENRNKNDEAGQNRKV
jgi:hypothetical protein